MKRFTMTVALLLMAAMPMMAERVTPETACKAASAFLSNNGAKATQLTDLSKAAGFSNLYIFTAEQGFVVMAADDRVKPVLGYSLTNTFVAEGMPENIRDWLQGYSDEIQYAVDNRISADAETAQLWKDLIEGNSKAAKMSTEVIPLIQTKWDQTGYYNLYCPAVVDGPSGRAYTGCVATAMAQIMKYWGYPSHGMGSYSYIWSGQTLSANFGETTYDWSNMKNHYQSYYDDEGNLLHVGTPSPDEIAAVSTLMYHCGVSLNMSYGGISTGGSSASTAAVVDALKTYFNYSLSMDYKTKSSYTNEAWIALVKAELDSERPLQYRGSSGGGGGHSFVCDGYDSSDNFHFNWGWAGWCNGFYSLSDLTTHDPGSGGGNGNYTNDQAAIFGIQPVQCTAYAPENLAYTQNGRDVILSWDEAIGATIYNIYLDNNLIGNANTNSYATTAPYGTHFYYVRSVDANGELSLSSNSVSVTVDYQTPIVNDLRVSLSGSNANLNWTAPDWCYPETPSATLTYGDGTPSGYSLGYNNPEYHLYWGHCYPSSSLTPYSNMSVYMVSFYANAAGSYKVYIYKGTSAGLPETQVFEQSFSASSTGWVDVSLTDKYLFDASKDLWVFIYDPEGRGYPAAYSYYSGDNGNFYSLDPTSWIYTTSGAAFLIRTYLTDGTYTYNLYQDGTRIASNLTDTSYSGITLNDNAANQLVVKTNYYGGEAPSNMVGFVKGTASVGTLNMDGNDMMTLLANSILTVDGETSNSNPTHLILENGAQLIHNTADVQATVKKTIEPYTADDNGWYFIASPIAENTIPNENNGFLNGTPGQNNNTYDLYYYDEPSQQWKNYESQSFVIENKKGYLYANGETNGTTLQFAGTLSPSNNSIYINGLSYSSTILKGFNLVGNPFACNATVDKDYYIVDGPNVSIPETGHVIAPCEGVFVQASENDASVTFTKAVSAKGAKSTDCIDIVVTQNKTTIDRARVRFGEGEGLEKFNLEGQHTQISFQQNKQDFAVVYATAQNEMPVNFKASENGTYTISMESKNFDLDYLHLIDNLTGNDIDLLVTPSYTFEAKTTDYASRFRLVFSNCEDAVGDNEIFAYVNNGNIVVNEEGTLQIVDMTGRVIVSCSGRIQCVPTTGMAPGVYVLRLINTEGVKTQKIVVE